MARSSKKGPYIDPKLLLKVQKAKASNDRTPIKTWKRACTIPPEFVGVTIAIHNGRIHVPVLITEGMVGHRLGEVSPTRYFPGHGRGVSRELTKT